VTNACTGTHHLNISSSRDAFISEVIMVRDGTLLDVGDDLQIGVWMEPETGVWCHFVIVEDDEISKRLVRRIAELANRKMVLCFQPAESPPAISFNGLCSIML
jgi:hypothetical protein